MNFKIYDWLLTSDIRLTPSWPDVSMVNLPSLSDRVDSDRQPILRADRRFSTLNYPLNPADFNGVAFQLVRALHHQGITSFDTNILAELLARPLSIGRSHIRPLIQLIGAMIQVESQHKPIPRTQSTWLALQIAYLQGLEILLTQEENLRKPWLNRSWMAQFPLVSETQTPEIPWVTQLETLRRKRLSDVEIEKLLGHLGQGPIINQIHQAIQGWLVANGAEERESQLLVQRLNQGLFGQLLKTIAEHHISLPQLQKFVRIGDSIHWFHGAGGAEYEVLEPPTTSGGRAIVDLKREFYRTALHSNLSLPCFEESFSWSQLYIIPRGFPAHTPDLNKSISLLDWANEQLSDSHSLALIEGPSGLGKTRFCQWWAAKIAQEVYPQWMPIVISLSQVQLGNSLEETLNSVFPVAQFTCTEGWLKPGLPPCLLILDSLESIPYSCVGDDPYQKLLEQIARFQQQYRDPRGWPRHKIVLTSRSDFRSRLALEQKIHQSDVGGFQGVLKTRFPLKIARFKLELMDLDALQEWFKSWSKLQTREIAKSYFDFLKQAGLFSSKTGAKELAALVRKPLMLYLLGVLHRDGFLEPELIEIPFPGVKLEIYDRIMTWLLGQTTPGIFAGRQMEKLIRSGLGHAGRSREAIASFLQGRSALTIRLLSQKVGLLLLQTGQNSLEITSVKEKLNWNGSEPLELPSFLFQITSNIEVSEISSVRECYQFSHRSLGEYLGAEAIADRLKSLMDLCEDWTIEAIAEMLYSLLGFGLLPYNIEDLIVERLQREQQRYPHSFSLTTLGDRLDRFYASYCQSRWMGTEIPQQAYDYFRSLGNPINLLQVDGVVGVNLLLLLAAISRVSDIPFYPCGIPEGSHQFNSGLSSVKMEIGRSLRFNPNQLLALAGRASILSPLTLWQRLGRDLSGLYLPSVHLQQAILPESHLQRTHLEGAILMGIQLSGAQMQGTQLCGADLSGADLSGADLSGADLSMANLTGAKLQGACIDSTNFSNACLYQAAIDREQQALIESQGVFWTVEQYLAYQEASWTENKSIDPHPTDVPPDPDLFPAIEVAEDETIAIDTRAYQQEHQSAQLDETVSEADVQVHVPTIAYSSDEAPSSNNLDLEHSINGDDRSIDTVVYTGDRVSEEAEDDGVETVIYQPPIEG